MKCSRKWFEAHKIAAAGDYGYSVSEYIAVVDGDRAFIFYNSHCSCYGTWDGGLANVDNDTDETEITESWSGTVAELVAKATAKEDLVLSGKTVTEDDFDGSYLLELYADVLTWHAAKEERK